MPCHPLTATLFHPLLAYARTQLPADSCTLDQAETAVTELFRSLGPQLVEGLLQGVPATDPVAEKKGGRRSVRVAGPSATTRSHPAP